MPPVADLLVGDLEALTMLKDRLECEHGRSIGASTQGVRGGV
jgi:hypothetical protein